MGLFRALLVIVVSSIVLSVIDDGSRARAVPLVGESLEKQCKDKKHIIIIFVLALLELFL